MGTTLHDVLGPNVDDVAPNERGRVQSKRLVLLYPEYVLMALSSTVLATDVLISLLCVCVVHNGQACV